MLTGSEMARVDRNAAALGVSPTQLMESAGNAVARAVRAEAQRGDRIVVVAGRGHNGGDALVAARFLGSPWAGPDAAPRGVRAGSDYDVTVLLLGRPESLGSLPLDNWDALREGAVDARTVTDASAFELPPAAVVVDGLLGTGVSGALREPAATAARAINDAEATVVSVDVPSGLDAETGALPALHVEPDRVVTFHDRKPGLSDLDADVEVADIGIPATAETFVGPGDLLALSRDPHSHKGQHGEVLVVGGGPYTGAPALAARAALRAGADLVRVACPESVAREVQGYAESLIVRPFDGERFGPDDVEPVLDLTATHDAVVFGPGLGDAAETRDAAVAFLSGYDGTVVVDADALAAVPEADVDATVIATPHRGELR
ncbi:MAG: NAD(P)H-hydrate epimerase, partial [Halobacteriales archaeon]